MSLVAARFATTRALRVAIRRQPQRRNVQTVPNTGTKAQMEAEILSQIEARVARQKGIVKNPQLIYNEELDEMWKWIKISFFIAIPVCFVSSMKDIFAGDHHARQEGELPDYMRIRSKAFPWECEDCELFNLECWEKCRADKAAEAAGN